MQQQRTWVAHLGAVVGLLVAGGAGLVLAARAMIAAVRSCEPDFSEATIVAPQSARGRLLCTVTDAGDLAVRDVVVVALPVVVLVALTAAVVAWAVSRRFRVLLPCLAAVVLGPLALQGGAGLLSPDCTGAERERHGAPGCERNEEERPGIGRY